MLWDLSLEDGVNFTSSRGYHTKYSYQLEKEIEHLIQKGHLKQNVKYDYS